MWLAVRSGVGPHGRRKDRWNLGTLLSLYGRSSMVQCRFTSTETLRTIRDVEPGTATSTLAQLLSSERIRVRAQCCFASTEAVRTIRAPRLSHSSERIRVRAQCCFMSTETIRTIRDVKPRTATSTFTQRLSSVWPCRRTDLRQLLGKVCHRVDGLTCYRGAIPQVIQLRKHTGRYRDPGSGRRGRLYTYIHI